MILENLSAQTTDDLHRKLENHITRKKKLEADLVSIEKKIYAYESLLLEENAGRTIFRGTESSLHKRDRKVAVMDSERLFSADLPRD